jgi:hypothetical protein
MVQEHRQAERQSCRRKKVVPVVVSAGAAKRGVRSANIAPYQQ